MVFILIDDDPIANLLHKKIIERTCSEKIAEIIEFTSARKALDYMVNCEKCEQMKNYFVLLDINMPEINGWEFLELLNKARMTWRNIFILSSSVARFDIVRAKNNSSVKGYLTKPLSTPSLENIVQEFQ